MPHKHGDDAHGHAPHGKHKGRKHYFNRELSWLQFNARVLEEAHDKSHPLLERLKFLAIFSSNLDEFFMIRVSGLKEQISAGIHEPTPDGMSPSEQLREISERLRPMIQRQSAILQEEILPKLRSKGVSVADLDRLSEARQEAIAEYFREKVFPILTPLAIDPAHPIPKLRGLGLNLLVELKLNGNGRQPKKIAVVPVPTLLPRFYSYVHEGRCVFVPIEDIIAAHIELLFPNMKIVGISQFRVTRNADLDISEAEADDLLKLIERELRKRRLGSIIRLEVSDRMSDHSVVFLREAFDLEPEDVYTIEGPLGLNDFMMLLGAVDKKDLKDEPFTPALHPRLAAVDSLFDAIRQQDILLHHPYDSFHPIVQLIEEAARDPHVLAIKQTLYRPSGRSAIAAALREAALNGKQVTALIELKARFDEETNITWARELERVGVNVVYGMLGLKIHGKMLMILRQEADGIRRYVHLSTGNYNEKTATLYTDFGLLTCNKAIGEDVSELFNMLTGYSQQEEWREIFVAPVNMRQNLLHLLQQAKEAKAAGQHARVRLVMNSLVDEDMIEHLYKASQHGVQIECIVRGICCLQPGVPGVSENITVKSVVGRFLEHSRVYCFEIGGETEVYCGSADWMPRNLNRRIEVVFPVSDQALKTQLLDILEVMFSDNVKARVLDAEGNYHLHEHVNVLRVNSQEVFLKRARERQRHIDTIYMDR